VALRGSRLDSFRMSRLTGALLWAVPVVAFACSCTTYTENGALVRHYFGYVKVITPALHAPDAPVQALGVETYGVWLSTDTRPRDEQAGVLGMGAGYLREDRELIPLDCRVVIRVTDRQQIADVVAALAPDAATGRGTCVVQDLSPAS